MRGRPVAEGGERLIRKDIYVNRCPLKIIEPIEQHRTI